MTPESLKFDPLTALPAPQAKTIEKPQAIHVGQKKGKKLRPYLRHLNSVTWMALDFGIAALAVFAAYLFSPFAQDAASRLTHLDPTRCAIFFAFFVTICGHVLGLHDPRLQRYRSKIFVKVLCTVLIAIIAVTVVASSALFLQIGRYILLISAVSTIAGLYFSRVTVWRFTASHQERVCVLGTELFCKSAAKTLNALSNNVEVKAIQVADLNPVSDDSHFVIASKCPQQSEFSLSVHTGKAEENTLHHSKSSNRFNLREWVLENEIDEILVQGYSMPLLSQALVQCLDSGIRIGSYSKYIERKYWCVPVNEIDHGWFLAAEIESLHPYYVMAKRVGDVLLSTLGMILSLPILLMAILLIKLTSKGPAFYSQIRLGQRNCPFRIYKLRTMRTDAEKEGAQWAKEHDNRVTRIGKILRKTRIDEIPQFWNILKGDMAFIGPRPERPEFVEQLSEEIPFYSQRHLVKPGLTGWAQINHSYGASVDDAMQKLKYDLYYVKHASLELDIHITLRTIGAVMKGAR